MSSKNDHIKIEKKKFIFLYPPPHSLVGNVFITCGTTNDIWSGYEQTIFTYADSGPINKGRSTKFDVNTSNSYLFGQPVV